MMCVKKEIHYLETVDAFIMWCLINTITPYEKHIDTWLVDNDIKSKQLRELLIKYCFYFWDAPRSMMRKNINTLLHGCKYVK